jgi:hypothetical protein
MREARHAGLAQAAKPISPNTTETMANETGSKGETPQIREEIN